MIVNERQRLLFGSTPAIGEVGRGGRGANTEMMISLCPKIVYEDVYTCHVLQQ